MTGVGVSTGRVCEEELKWGHLTYHLTYPNISWAILADENCPPPSEHH